jgi:hypothetical protein
MFFSEWLMVSYAFSVLVRMLLDDWLGYFSVNAGYYNKVSWTDTV